MKIGYWFTQWAYIDSSLKGPGADRGQTISWIGNA